MVNELDQVQFKIGDLLFDILYDINFINKSCMHTTYCIGIII